VAAGGGSEGPGHARARRDVAAAARAGRSGGAAWDCPGAAAAVLLARAISFERLMSFPAGAGRGRAASAGRRSGIAAAPAPGRGFASEQAAKYPKNAPTHMAGPAGPRRFAWRAGGGRDVACNPRPQARRAALAQPPMLSHPPQCPGLHQTLPRGCQNCGGCAHACAPRTLGRPPRRGRPLARALEPPLALVTWGVFAVELCIPQRCAARAGAGTDTHARPFNHLNPQPQKSRGG
jgi:hypothetical protein